MPFRLLTWEGSRNHLLDGCPDPCVKGQLREKGAAHCKAYLLSVVSCVKVAGPIEVPFGMLSGVSLRKHALDRGSDPPMCKDNFEGKGAAHSKV